MINWDDIDTVFLDMDGTLLDLHFDNRFWLEHIPKCYGERNGISAEAAKEKLFPRMRELRGKLDWYCTTFWSKELDLPIIELKRELSHLIQSRELVEPFLQRLRARDKKIILFTNAHEDTLVLKMEMTGLASAFDQAITSHSLGHAKEKQQAWEVLASRYEFDRQRALFIDDSFSVLDSARVFGIGHLLGIRKPDSKGKEMVHDHYTLLESFAQIMPE